MTRVLTLALVAAALISACAEKQAARRGGTASSSGDEEPVVDVSCGLEVDRSRFEPAEPEP